MNWSQFIYDWLFSFFAELFAYLNAALLSAFAAVRSVLEIVARWVLDLMIDFGCWAIDNFVGLIIAVIPQNSSLGDGIVISGEVLFFMNEYLPLAETLSIVAFYYSAVVAVYALRHIIKFIPAIG